MKSWFLEELIDACVLELYFPDEAAAKKLLFMDKAAELVDDASSFVISAPSTHCLSAMKLEASSTIKGKTMKRADEILKPWPKAWMGMPEDEVFGEKLIVELKPFVESLIARGYAKKTLDRHIGNLFLMGGEIIRSISIDEDYDANPAMVLRDAVLCGEGPLCQHLHTEEEQRAYDATCRKLHKFLERG